MERTDLIDGMVEFSKLIFVETFLFFNGILVKAKLLTF